MLHTAVSLIPDCVKEQPIIFSVDDTMTEKSGEHFEYCSVLFVLFFKNLESNVIFWKYSEIVNFIYFWLQIVRNYVIIGSGNFLP